MLTGCLAVCRCAPGHRHPHRQPSESEPGRAGVEAAGWDEPDHRRPQRGRLPVPGTHYTGTHERVNTKLVHNKLVLTHLVPTKLVQTKQVPIN